MDTISTRLLRYNLAKSENNTFRLLLDSLKLVNQQNQFKISILQNDKNSLTSTLERTELKLENNKQQHALELDMWKAKARNRFTSFLLGTSIGALIVAILTITL